MLARAAKELVHVSSVEMEDLVFTFDKVRPHGRIFHGNLFQHASEVVKDIVKNMKLKPEELRRKDRVSEELDSFLEERRKLRRQRIRWRRFDSDGDSRLSEEEGTHLCAELQENPDKLLFFCTSEVAPTTHPPYRERILALKSNA